MRSLSLPIAGVFALSSLALAAPWASPPHYNNAHLLTMDSIQGADTTKPQDVLPTGRHLHNRALLGGSIGNPDGLGPLTPGANPFILAQKEGTPMINTQRPAKIRASHGRSRKQESPPSQEEKSPTSQGSSSSSDREEIAKSLKEIQITSETYEAVGAAAMAAKQLSFVGDCTNSEDSCEVSLLYNVEKGPGERVAMLVLTFTNTYPQGVGRWLRLTFKKGQDRYPVFRYKKYTDAADIKRPVTALGHVKDLAAFQEICSNTPDTKHPQDYPYNWIVDVVKEARSKDIISQYDVMSSKN
ncbi:MAG: hypothetical protein M1829_002230 [Trizodia sp. TS-e1964]|nr:MAG: hypothetical protein M1829_002230 [Trizodia sp. TS-e1964]